MKTLESFAEAFKTTLDSQDKRIEILRKNAFEEFSKAGIPTRKQEYWKFSDPSVILNLNLKYNDSSSDFDDNYHLILGNGKIIKNTVKGKSGSISEGIKKGYIDENVLEIKENPFLNLNSAFAVNGSYICLEKNSENNIRILNLIDNNGIEQAVYPKIVIVAGENSNATIFEEFRVVGKGTNFVNSVTNISMNQGSNIEHIILDDYAENTYHIANIYAELKRDSNFISHNFSIGKKFARRDFNIELTETGTNCDLNGLYFASDDAHIDHHTTIEHMKNNLSLIHI